MSDQADPNLVKELLARESAQPGGDTVTRGQITVDEATQEELRAALNTGGEKPTEGPRIETPLPNPAFNPDVSGVDDVFKWLFNSSRLGEITVSETERNTFWKSMLNDTRCVLEIELPGPGKEKMVVRVHNLTAYEQQVVAGALAQDEKDGIIKGLESMATMMQGYSILLQVQALNNAAFATYTPSADLPFLDAVLEIQRKVKGVIWPMNAPRLVMLVKAVALFEHKMKLCNDGLVNRDFWSPPSIA